MPNTTRLALRYPLLSDAADVPLRIQQLAEDIDKAAIYSQGALASRPTSTPGSPGIQGRYYLATDLTPQILYLDYGTGWISVGAIPGDSITAAEIAPNAIGASELADGAVDTGALADGAVTTVKHADGSVTDVKIAAALKPSQGAAGATEALRALGTGPGNAAAGNDARFWQPGMLCLWPYAFGNAPAGFIRSDGQPVLKASYAALDALAAAAGYPDGSASTTFNTPDYRGRSIVGHDNMGTGAAGRITAASVGGGNINTVGGTGGAETHTLSAAQAPVMATAGGTDGRHSHAVNVLSGNHYNNPDGHDYLIDPSTEAVRGGNASGGGTAINGAAASGGGAVTDSAHSHSVNSGGGGLHNNMPPWRACNILIKT